MAYWGTEGCGLRQNIFQETLNNLLQFFYINPQWRRQYNNDPDLIQVKEKEISHLFDQYLSRIYHVPGTGNIAVKKNKTATFTN